MGNHTTPFDDTMTQQSYTVAENWGGQINFMVPLDGGIVERCKAAASKQLEKMELNYELVRIDNCAKLQQKGFMLLPGSRVYHICSDVIPISQWKKAQAKVLACRTPPKPWYKPWHKPKETCTTMTYANKSARELLNEEKAAEAAKATKKTTKTTTKK